MNALAEPLDPSPLLHEAAGWKSPSDYWDGHTYLVDHHKLIERVLRTTAWRQRLSPDEAEELVSVVWLKLVEDDYAVLRKFSGRSTLTTYLTTVISRVALDCRVARWGRWRPSAQARQLGAAGIRLEQLLRRDSCSFAEACGVLLTDRTLGCTAEELDKMSETLPNRPRVRVHGQDVLERLPASAVPSVHHDDAENSDLRSHRRRAGLAKALVSLPRADRQLVRMRYRYGWTVADIAGKTGLDQKRLYREYERIFRTLRTAMDTSVPVDLTPTRVTRR